MKNERNRPASQGGNEPIHCRQCGGVLSHLPVTLDRTRGSSTVDDAPSGLGIAVHGIWIKPLRRIRLAGPGPLSARARCAECELDNSLLDGTPAMEGVLDLRARYAAGRLLRPELLEEKARLLRSAMDELTGIPVMEEAVRQEQLSRIQTRLILMDENR